VPPFTLSIDVVGGIGIGASMGQYGYALSVSLDVAPAVIGIGGRILQFINMKAMPGTYGVNSAGAKVTYGKNTVALPGSFAVTANSGGKKQTYRLSCQANAFVATFRATTLSKGTLGAYQLTAAAGNYTLSGGAVMMEKGGATAGDPYFSNVSLLLNGEGFTDLSTNAITVYPEGNASIVSGQGPFGGAAIALNEYSDYLSIWGIEFGSSSFAWEFWIKTTDSEYTSIYQRVPGAFSAGMWDLLLENSSSSPGVISLYLGDYSTSIPLMQTAAAVNPWDNTWHFISVSRSGSSWSIAIDGVIRASATFSGSIASLSDEPFDASYGQASVGGGHTGNFGGLLGPFRITKGIARTITVPTEPFPTS
jgi:hypothetical protein